ncbi:UNVERIFIED_CONTAM: hypothetical protein GTU68_038163 [Idotea baltica]|nr:hypothetical protein [Idotea baltica]
MHWVLREVLLAVLLTVSLICPLRWQLGYPLF